MKKWIALILVVVAFTATARAVTSSEDTKSMTNFGYYPYYRDYPRTLLFEGSAMTKTKDTYPVLFLATEMNDNGIWGKNTDAKFFLILNGGVHEMELKDVDAENGVLIAELEGDGELVLMMRYQNYYSQVSVSGIYKDKYLLNLGLSNNVPVYKIMGGYLESAPVNTDRWIQGISEKITPAVGSSARVLPEDSTIEDLW